MPSVKQGGGYTLTFSKKNQDVKDHLDDLKKKKVVITDYICEAIRFYEKNKNMEIKSTIADYKDIDRIIEEKIKMLIGSYSQGNEEKAITEDVTENSINEKQYDLEDGSGIDDSDLEED